jgi:hypothetical protein
MINVKFMTYTDYDAKQEAKFNSFTSLCNWVKDFNPIDIVYLIITFNGV